MIPHSGNLPDNVSTLSDDLAGNFTLRRLPEPRFFQVEAVVNYTRHAELIRKANAAYGCPSSFITQGSERFRPVQFMAAGKTVCFDWYPNKLWLAGVQISAGPVMRQRTETRPPLARLMAIVAFAPASNLAVSYTRTQTNSETRWTRQAFGLWRKNGRAYHGAASAHNHNR